MDIFCVQVKPFECLNLSRVQFWLRIMKEHSLFMKLGFACKDTELIRQAEQFFGEFGALEKESMTINS